MKPSRTAGFTIIETMLFLGITSLLIVGVLAGSSASIDTQRYRDSVVTLQSFLQQQYSEVANVSNNNITGVCGSDTHVPRGQSDCLILGRYITSSDGKSLLIRRVVGNNSALSSLAVVDELSAIKMYGIAPTSASSETYNVEWGAYLVNPINKAAASFSILILRSPTSGSIRTFISPESVVDDNKISLELLTQSALTQSINVCVNSDSLFAGSKSAIYVSANSNGASGVETLGVSEVRNTCQ